MTAGSHDDSGVKSVLRIKGWWRINSTSRLSRRIAENGYPCRIVPPCSLTHLQTLPCAIAAGRRIVVRPRRW